MNLLRTISSLWQCKDFVASAVKREFQARYRGSLLGASWNIINPLILVFIYTVIFSQVMQSRFPVSTDRFAYSIYLCSGLLAWGWFVEITTRFQTMFLENSNLLKKANFPRICLPIIVIISSVINFAIVFGIFLLFLVLSGHFPGLVFFTFFPVLLIQLVFSIGLGVLTGTLNVFFRDVGNIMGVLLQFWFWLTPIVYPISAIPAVMRDLLVLNPLAPIIQAYQGIFLRGVMPEWSSLLPALLIAIFFFFLGSFTFNKCSNELVDEL